MRRTARLPVARVNNLAPAGVLSQPGLETGLLLMTNVNFAVIERCVRTQPAKGERWNVRG